MSYCSDVEPAEAIRTTVVPIRILIRTTVVRIATVRGVIFSTMLLLSHQGICGTTTRYFGDTRLSICSQHEIQYSYRHDRRADSHCPWSHHVTVITPGHMWNDYEILW